MYMSWWNYICLCLCLSYSLTLAGETEFSWANWASQYRRVRWQWRGVWNKALSDFWCNVKFSSSFTTEYKENWKENLVIYQKSLKAFLQASLQFECTLNGLQSGWIWPYLRICSACTVINWCSHSLAKSAYWRVWHELTTTPKHNLQTQLKNCETLKVTNW